AHGCPIPFDECRFDSPINLSDATAPIIRLIGCEFPRLDAQRVHTRGDLDLSLSVASIVNVEHAHIGGDLSLRGAALTNPSGETVIADGVRVDQGVLFWRFSRLSGFIAGAG